MKKFIPLLIIVFAACSDTQLQKKMGDVMAENDSLKKEIETLKGLDKKQDIAFVQVVKFKSLLPDSQVVKMINERKVRFLNVPGLVQKYYMKEKATGEYSGIYLWASEEDFLNYRQSELGKTIGTAYKTDGKPRLELFEMLFPLREM